MFGSKSPHFTFYVAVHKSEGSRFQHSMCNWEIAVTIKRMTLALTWGRAVALRPTKSSTNADASFGLLIVLRAERDQHQSNIGTLEDKSGANIQWEFPIRCQLPQFLQLKVESPSSQRSRH